MSFMGSFGDAKNANGVEESKTMGTSPIRDGASGPGGAAAGTKPASGEMTQRRTTLRTRTGSLVRKYPESA